MHVVSIGEVLVDWLSLTPGKTLLNATAFHRALGGNATNVAIGLTRLGTKVTLIGRIGSDLHGDFVRNTLNAEGIDLNWIACDPKHSTTQCYMTTTEDGAHQYRNWPHPNANDMLSFEDLPQEIIRGCDLLHTTAISMVVDPRCSTVEKAIELAHDSGAIISFDASLPPAAFQRASKRVESIFSQTHLLKVNAGELMTWAGMDGHVSADVEDVEFIKSIAKDIFTRYRPQALLVTLGSKGSLVFTAQDMISCPSLAVQAVSEVGAGDAFCAGFIHFLGRVLPARQGNARDRLAKLKPDDWRRAGLSGNVAGALATLQENAYGGLPNQTELNNHLRQLEQSNH